VVMKEGKIFANAPPEEIIDKALMESVYEVAVEVILHPHSGKPLLLLG
jgi:ABC-type cobalamin/Fe3+-siderophores transport system ATPase subunit